MAQLFWVAAPLHSQELHLFLQLNPISFSSDVLSMYCDCCSFCFYGHRYKKPILEEHVSYRSGNPTSVLTCLPKHQYRYEALQAEVDVWMIVTVQLTSGLSLQVFDVFICLRDLVISLNISSLWRIPNQRSYWRINLFSLLPFTLGHLHQVSWILVSCNELSHFHMVITCTALFLGWDRSSIECIDRVLLSGHTALCLRERLHFHFFLYLPCAGTVVSLSMICLLFTFLTLKPFISLLHVTFLGCWCKCSQIFDFESLWLVSCICSGRLCF